MKDNRFKMKVDARLEKLSAIADFVTATMRRLGIKEGIYEVQTAVDEACTNVVEHAYSDSEGIITISCDLQDNDFIITIRDNGRPFDFGSMAPPDLETDLEGRQIGGLGIYLMRKLMDEVSYTSDAERGNTLILRREILRGG